MMRALLLPCLVLAVGCATRAPSRPPPAASPVELALPIVENESPWTYLGMKGRRLLTRHYALHTTEDHPELLERLPRFLEAAITNYTTAFGPLPDPLDPMDTYFFAHRWQWERATQQTMGAQADVFLRIQRGGFAAGGKGIYYNIGPRDSFSVAAHEGWHQYTQSVFKDQLPMWLEEGIAAYMEGFRWDLAEFRSPRFMGWANVERFDQLRAAADAGRLMPLRELLLSAPQSLLGDSADGALTYYAQVWALTHFLREGDGGRHRGQLALCLEQAAGGRLYAMIASELGPAAAQRAALRRVGPEVFLVYFDSDLDRASRQYDAFLQQVIRAGSREEIVQGVSPFNPPTRNP